MKARPWSRITHVGGPDNPASFPPYAEAQARRLLRPYRDSVEPAIGSTVAPAAAVAGAVTGAVVGGPMTNGSAAERSVAATGDEPWDTLIAAAAAGYAAPEFAERRVNRVLRVSEALRRTRGALLAALRARTGATVASSRGSSMSGSGSANKRAARPRAWPVLLGRAAALEAAVNVAGVPAQEEPSPILARFADWCVAHPDAGEAALAALWAGASGDKADAAGKRLRAFLPSVPASVASSAAERLHLASWLLLALDPMRYAVYDEALFQAGYALTGQPLPAADADEAETYAQALALLDRIAEEAARRGLPIRHRLHARGVLESVARWHTSDVARPQKVAAPRAPFAAARDLAALADDLLLDAGELETIRQLLFDKGQCIFYGPPGTGKTYVARRLAAWLAGDEARAETVQFHPSYTYEDFVEGYRPQLIDGQPGFALVDGPLKRLARAAARDPQRPYVLVVDELNRGNVAKVFGELYFLLEYREQAITLQYSGASFRLPQNLWLIGTMNTADRSIALVDLALRRRFYFVPFFPDQPPVAGLLDRWLARYQPHLTWLAGVVDEANRLLAAREAAIGPSYFLRSDLDEQWIFLIWEHAVLPYVAEQLAGDEDALAGFALDRLRAKVTPAMVKYPSRRRKKRAPESPRPPEG